MKVPGELYPRETLRNKAWRLWYRNVGYLFGHRHGYCWGPQYCSSESRCPPCHAQESLWDDMDGLGA